MQTVNPPLSEILVIGRDSPLTYLIGRYAEQGGFRMTAPEKMPSMEEIGVAKPVAILSPMFTLGIKKAVKGTGELRTWLKIEKAS